MSEQKIRRAFRTTKIKISKENVPSSEARDALEQKFITLEAAKTDAVAAERVAAISQAKARAQLSKAQIAEMEFLQLASEHFTAVAGERFWIVYRSSKDTHSIVLEGFTERLLRNNIRAQQESLGEQVANLGSDSDVDRDSLYESDDPEADNEGKDEDNN